jgi:glutathione S-transferase
MRPVPLLVIGNKNYSSWSLRPWLLLRKAGIAFAEHRVPLYLPESKAEILSFSPAGKVPVLIDGEVTVWDSLAICEYLAEKHAGLRLWPDVAVVRAHARSLCAEMHSGFADLRTHLPMNCRRSLPGLSHPPGALADIARIIALFNDCRDKYQSLGPYLFGRFSVADAMYAPVVLRLQTYAVSLHGAAQDYARTMVALPQIQEWVTAAKAEREVIAKFERE